MNLIVINLLINTLDTTLIVSYLVRILGRTWKSTRKWIIFIIALILFNTFMNLIFDLTNFVRYILIFIGATIVYSNLLNIKFMKVLMYSLLGTIFMFTSEVVVMAVMTMIFKIDPLLIFQWNIYKVGAIITSKVLFYLMIRLLIGKKGKVINTEFYNINEMILMGIVNVVIVFMALNLDKTMEMGSSIECSYMIGIGIGGLGLNIYIYKVIQDRIYHKQQEIIWELREEEYHKKDFYIKNMTDILQQVKARKHEFNNCLSTLYGLIYLEKFEESKKYILEISGNSYNEITSIDNIIETNHPVITALVSMKKRRL